MVISVSVGSALGTMFRVGPPGTCTTPPNGPMVAVVFGGDGGDEELPPQPINTAHASAPNRSSCILAPSQQSVGRADLSTAARIKQDLNVAFQVYRGPRASHAWQTRFQSGSLAASNSRSARLRSERDGVDPCTRTHWPSVAGAPAGGLRFL